MLLKVLNIVLFLTWFVGLWHDDVKCNNKYGALVCVVAVLLAGFTCYAWNLT